jgi:hypothetical protein
MKKQTGLSMATLLVSVVILIVVILIGLKVGPAYMEYAMIKKAVALIAQNGETRTASVAEIRKSFDRNAQINDITIITSQDLDISKDGGDVVISFAYPKKVPLFSNVSLLIEFAGSSGH